MLEEKNCLNCNHRQTGHSMGCKVDGCPCEIFVGYQPPIEVEELPPATEHHAHKRKGHGHA